MKLDELYHEDEDVSLSRRIKRTISNNVMPFVVLMVTFHGIQFINGPMPVVFNWK